MNHHGRIVDFNETAERLFGRRRTDVLGGEMADLVIPERLRETHRAGLRHYLATGHGPVLGRRIEFPALRADGTEFPVELSITRVPSVEPPLFTGFVRDVSDRQRIEQVQREAKDAAETANRVKSEFLANVSHELRTPMNAVLGMLHLTLREKLTPAMRDNLRTAQDSAESLMALLNDILDFSRIEEGKFELEFSPFSLRETLAAAMKTLSMRADEKGLELACHVEVNVPDMFWGDGRRLRQVVLNLAGNAVKFTEQGEVVTKVSVESRWVAEPEDDEPDDSDPSLNRNPEACAAADASSDMDRAENDPPVSERHTRPRHDILLHITVSDTGIGIEHEQQSRIFAPFTQVDAMSTRAFAGTGLGLTICRELLELMGGQIWVESELGRGCRFHALAQFQVEASEPIVDSFRHALLVDLVDMPVLVVEDHPTSRLIAEEMLRGWEMQPTSVGDGQSALSVLRDAARQGRDFPLVILDMSLPDMDGIALLEQIRQDDRLDTAVILLLPATQRQTFAERLRSLEIAAYLEKPVTQSDLLDAILLALHEPLFGESTVELVAGLPRVLRVLVAEDILANQKVTRAILTQRGHIVEIVPNGRAALDRVQQAPFDVVLMDVQMPIMDGLQATAAIRRLGTPAMRSLPIIAMTAHAMPGDRDRCLAAGMTDYLAKPIDAFKLIYLVERLAAKTSSEPTRKPLDTAEPTRNPTVTAEADSGGLLKNSRSIEFDVPEPILVDREAALKRLGGNEQLYRNLVRFFAEDSPGLLVDIRSGLRTGDREQVTRAAHSLKGLAANFGCEAAMKSAVRMQEIGTSGSLEEATSALESLTDAITKLNLALTADRTVRGPSCCPAIRRSCLLAGLCMRHCPPTRISSST